MEVDKCSSNQLFDKTILISGGAGRIGSAISRAITARGGNVIIGDVDTERGKSLVRTLNPEHAVFFNADLTIPKNVKKAVETATTNFGRLEYPRSAGWGSSFEDLKPEHLEEDLVKQLGGTILFSQGVVKA